MCTRRRPPVCYVPIPHPSIDTQAEAPILRCAETTNVVSPQFIASPERSANGGDPKVPAYPKGDDRHSQSKVRVHRQGGCVSLEEPYPRNRHIHNSGLWLYPVRSVIYKPASTICIPLFIARVILLLGSVTPLPATTGHQPFPILFSTTTTSHCC